MTVLRPCQIHNEAGRSRGSNHAYGRPPNTCELLTPGCNTGLKRRNEYDIAHGGFYEIERKKKKKHNYSATMAEAPSPKTPEKTIEGDMDDLTLAPRKMKHGPCLTRFLHEPLDNVKREFHLSGKRICCYNFDKINREVRLSTVDSDERFTYDTCDDPSCFHRKDWSFI